MQSACVNAGKGGRRSRRETAFQAQLLSLCWASGFSGSTTAELRQASPEKSAKACRVPMGFCGRVTLLVVPSVVYVTYVWRMVHDSGGETADLVGGFSTSVELSVDRFLKESRTFRG